MNQEENNGRKPYISLLKDKKDFPGWSYELMVRLCDEGLWHCISDAPTEDSHSRPITSEEAHSQPDEEPTATRQPAFEGVDELAPDTVKFTQDGVNRRGEI
jgi:hypothetical protein